MTTVSEATMTTLSTGFDNRQFRLIRCIIIPRLDRTPVSCRHRLLRSEVRCAQLLKFDPLFIVHFFKISACW